MSVMKSLYSKSQRQLAGGGAKKKAGSGKMSVSTFSDDMQELLKDLTGRQMKEATKAMSFILRQQVVQNLRKGSSQTTIGESKKGKMTRGDWKSGIQRAENGYEYLKGGWAGSVLKNRGANKKSMAFNGGDTHSGRGNRGIISRTVPTRGGGWVSITGPRYGTDSGDDSQAGYNYAHTLEYGASHKAWGKNASPLKPRPFLGPAAAMARNKQVSKLTKMMKKWGKGQ